MSVCNNSNERCIYVDLDGVLVDFDKGVSNITNGIGRDEYIKTYSVSLLWEKINMFGSDWWAHLPWMGDGKILWDWIKNKNCCVLTSCSARNTGVKAIEGKTKWIHMNLGSIKNIIVDSWDMKQNYATPTDILIDDALRNINQWKDKGGIGILHTDSLSTIEQLKTILNEH